MKGKVGVFVSDSSFSHAACRQLENMGYDVITFSFEKKVGFGKEIILDFGDIDGFLNYVRKNGVERLVFAGKIEASSIFKRDISQSGKNFLNGIRDLRPQKIFEELAGLIVRNKIEILPLTKVFKNHLAEEKIYTISKPDTVQWNDIFNGWKIAKSIAQLDIGQAVAIKNGMVVAVEAIEGTDAMIKRAGKFCKDFVVVKVIRSGQDTRFDLPTIGPETVKNLVYAGGKVLAVEAGKTVFIDQERTIRVANENKLVIVGFRGKEIKGDNQGKSR
ncbi:MAG: LpxI family protein [Candidatus Omnitrophica bacterium]|nr:LpxI family protein [Candidatus Omnitrophota bacterium]